MIELDNAAYTYPFQPRPVLKDVSIRVEPGELVLITGPSGGGKTTLLRLINGLIPHVHGGTAGGRALLDGRDMRQLDLRGVSAVVSALFQDPHKQFLALTVSDEIALALEWRGFSPRAIAARVEQSLDDFGLKDVRDASLYELSEGQKQKTALASLMALGPRALTLDEPTANLDPQASAELATHLKRLKEAGVALVVADHRLAWLSGIVDRVYVVAGGQVVASGSEAILHDDGFRRRHGLRAAQLPECPLLPEGGCAAACDAVAGWSGLTFAYRGRPAIFEDAALALPARAVTALTGPNGCGKTTLARLMAGLVRPRRGALTMKGRPTRPRQLLATTGMAMQNSELQLYQRTALGEVEQSAGRRRNAGAMQWLERFGLAEVAGRHPQSLSGGQKQRLVVACAAARAGELLILDEPTSGLDGAQMLALAEMLDERLAEGRASLVITHDIELIDRVCTHELRLPLSDKPMPDAPPPASSELQWQGRTPSKPDYTMRNTP